MSAAILSLLALLSLTGYAPVQDSVRIQATINPSTIAAGEMATLELHIETRGERAESITLPDLPPALELIPTGDYEQFQYSLPGGRSRIIRREYAIRVTDPGIYRIPPITVQVRGERYNTTPLTLTVTDGGGGNGAANRGGSGSAGPGGPSIAPPPPIPTGPLPGGGSGSLARGARNEVILHSRLTTDTAYVNQQVTLRTQTWVSEETQFRLRRAPEYHPPNASGFWTHDLPGPLQGGRQYFDDMPYRVQEFQRAYFPLAPGDYALPPARLVYEARRAFLTGTDPEELATDSLRLVVLPFPEAGRPVGFAGAVGQYQISARIEPAHVPVGEAAALIVEIEGTGNINALPPPAPPRLGGIELHPPAEDAEVRIRQGRIGGRKRFTWIMVPREHGFIEIPPLEYHYFDPELREYRIARTSPLALQVDEGAGSHAAIGAPTAHEGQGTEAPPAEPDRIRGLRLEPAGEVPLAWIRSPLVLLAILAAPILALLLPALRHQRARAATESPSPRKRRRQSRVVLDRLRHDPGDDAFFVTLAELIRTEIAIALRLPPPARGSGSTLAAALEENDFPGATAGALGRLLARCEEARFEPNPPGPERRLSLLREAEHLLPLLERTGNGRERGRREQARDARRGQKTRHTSAGIVLLLSLPLTATAQERPPEFSQPVASYQAGEFDAAASGFATYLNTTPRDPAAWYNLGNAEFQAGRHGPAIQAWLRALRLEPRAPDTRHNLRVAGADPGLLAAATRGLPLTEEELLLFAALTWLVAAASLAAYTITRRRHAAVAAAGAASIALVALAALLAPKVAPTTAVALPDEIPLRVAPEPRARPIDHLNAGDLVRIHQQRGGWLRVSAANGAEGWVEDDDVGTF
jgi:tetratricopeptide (TPR) repeat protein